MTYRTRCTTFLQQLTIIARRTHRGAMVQLIEGEYRYDPGWLPIVGGIFFGIVGTFVLYLWCTV